MFFHTSLGTDSPKFNGIVCEYFQPVRSKRASFKHLRDHAIPNFQLSIQVICSDLKFSVGQGNILLSLLERI